MQQHLGRLEGVDKVDVSLADGKVAILAKVDSRLDPAKVFQATYDSGVSITEMTMEATGWLEHDARNSLTLRVSSSQIYAVVENDVVKSLGASLPTERVFVRALLYKKTGRQNPKTLGNVRLVLIEVRKP